MRVGGSLGFEVRPSGWAEAVARGFGENHAPRFVDLERHTTSRWHMALAMASRLTGQPSQTRRARSPASRRVFHAAETDVDVFPPAWDRGGFVDDRVEQWFAAGLAADHVPGLIGARRRLQLREALQGL